MSERPPYLERLLHWPRFLARADADPGHLYDLRGEGAIETGGDLPVVNMGYWPGIDPKEPRSLERATYALFDLVAEGAGIRPGDDVVDAGCGFGTCALHVAERFGPRSVTGVNVSAVQLATARHRAAEAGRHGQVAFVHGSVTSLPMEDATVDCVLSTEAAFHFDTRDAFFAEAFRVLRPGGRLSMVDLVVPPAAGLFQRVALECVIRSQAVPRANLYGMDDYVRRVRDAGFVIDTAESIHDRVFPQFRRWQLTRPIALVLRYDFLFILASAPYLVYPFDYLRLVATKR